MISPRAILLALLMVSAVFADGPGDNIADKTRPIPPPGRSIPEEARAELQEGLEKLGTAMREIRSETKRSSLKRLLPDVQIFYNAVDYGLRYNEFLKGTNDLPSARKLLEQGLERAAELRDGKASWTNATGLVARGYTSEIDGSVQPYGLVVPPDYATSSTLPRRLDAWFHGRGEDLTELRFIIDRERDYGQFVPPGAFVLHLYGRYCNANKLAGEIDLLEELADVKRNYRIDEDRVLVR
jgi:hypothetical protein